MGRGKTMEKKGKILSRPRTRKFDMRKEDFGFDGTERRIHPELSEGFSRMHEKISSQSRAFTNEMPPAYKEIGDYIIKVFGDQGMIGIIDRDQHPELSRMTLDEIKKVEEKFIRYLTFDEEEFRSLAVKINGEDVMTDAAQTFYVMFPELFGKYRNRTAPANLRELCNATGLKHRDRVRANAEIRMTVDLCFKEVEPSSGLN